MNLRKVWYKIQSIPYEIKCLIFPYNKLKIQGLDRHYHDRDEVMFHAMFQCLVDYVELEHPFRSWIETDKKRFTDINAMHSYIEDNFGESSLSLEQELAYGASIKRQYNNYIEQLNLYVWYKKIYSNRIDPFNLVGDFEADDIFDFEIQKYPNALITLQEASDMDTEFEAEEDKMLLRLLKIRRALWT